MFQADLKERLPHFDDLVLARLGREGLLHLHKGSKLAVLILQNKLLVDEHNGRMAPRDGVVLNPDVAICAPPHKELLNLLACGHLVNRDADFSQLLKNDAVVVFVVHLEQVVLLALKCFDLERELGETDFAVKDFPLVLNKPSLLLFDHFGFNPFADTVEVDELDSARAVTYLDQGVGAVVLLAPTETTLLRIVVLHVVLKRGRNLALGVTFASAGLFQKGRLRVHRTALLLFRGVIIFLRNELETVREFVKRRLCSSFAFLPRDCARLQLFGELLAVSVDALILFP